MRYRRLLALLCAAGTALGVAAAGPAYAVGLPTTYIVSQEAGTAPEGIAVTSDGTMYVTSVGTGAVYRGNVHDPRLRPFLPAGSDGRTQATGIHLDPYGRIFVAGYATATLFVYAPDGRLLAARKAPDPTAALNDLAFTGDAVYVTDSATGTLWRASLTASTVGPLTAWLPPSAFPVAPWYHNGIVTTPDGRFALLTDQGTEKLFRVDLAARSATVVAMTGGSMGADGLLLEGWRLYGTVNFPDPAGGDDFVVRLAVLNPDFTAATVVAQSQAEGDAETPTTIARDHGRLLWVNSQLASPAPAPPYTVTEVPGLR
jgi:sugar lactone lactonase YvrE